jgi:hypothetical protein
MSQQRFSEMSEAEFDALIEGHIERTAASYGEMPADVFIDVLLERIAAKTSTTVMLELDVTDDRLVITPDRDSADIVVQGNEVLIAGHRLVLKLSHRPK